METQSAGAKPPVCMTCGEVLETEQVQVLKTVEVITLHDHQPELTEETMDVTLEQMDAKHQRP